MNSIQKEIDRAIAFETDALQRGETEKAIKWLNYAEGLKKALEILRNA